jgi:hypothetical membrane protein
MDKDYAPDLDMGSFLENRKATLESMNLSSTLIRENKDKMYSKVFYLFSLIFAVLIAIFSEYLNWLMILLFIDFSLFLLVLPAKRFYKRRRELAKQHYKIIDRLKEFGINIDKM